MAIDLDAVLTKGGKALIDLLQYAIYSVQPEPLFIHLVQEYRTLATVPRALALYDVFCTAGEPACLRDHSAIPPRDLRLQRDLAPFRQPLADDRPPPLLPPRTLFDFVVARLREQADGPLQRLAASYDPALSPHENLPGGKMSQGQRFFVEKVWQPRLRPRLVAAGFWRVAPLGG